MSKIVTLSQYFRPLLPRLQASNEFCMHGNMHWPCRDCGKNTQEIMEINYMLHDNIWKRASKVKASKYPLNRMTGRDNFPPRLRPMRDFSCIGCLEKRLKRKLKPDDFKPVLCSTDYLYPRSQRLKERMGYIKKTWNYQVWNKDKIFFYVCSDHKLTKAEKMDRAGALGLNPYLNATHWTLIEKVPYEWLVEQRKKLLEVIGNAQKEICCLIEIPTKERPSNP